MCSLLQPPHFPAGLKKVHHFSTPLFLFFLQKENLLVTLLILPFLVTAHTCCKDTNNVFKGLDLPSQLSTESL